MLQLMNSPYSRLLLILFLAVGCSPEPGSNPRDLEKSASLLKSGMTESEVKIFLSDYLLVTNVYEVGQVELKNRDSIFAEHRTRHIEVTKLYSPGGSYSSWIEFWPKKKYSYWEYCKVYFDTNLVLVGYYYEISGQW